MRTFIALVAIVGFLSAARPSARAEKPQERPTKSIAQGHAQETAAHHAAGEPAAQDTNYRHFKGQWWYWWPQTKSWKIWTGSAWVDYQPGQPQPTQRRAFSYDRVNAAQAPSYSYAPSYRQNFTGFPNSVRNTQIMGSFGFRSAGSKSDGNY